MAKIIVIGMGVVGSATAEILRRHGNEVYTNDIDASKCFNFIEIDTAPDAVDYIVICVPEKHVENVIRQWWSRGPFGTIVIRSTVPPGTADRLMDELGCIILSNPEFLRASEPLFDEAMPVRFVVGVRHNHATIADEYVGACVPLEDPGKIVITDNLTAEFTKLASNYVLATYVSMFNQLKLIADKYDVNSHLVAKILRMDPRISWYGSIHGKPYGGTCLPKDMLQLFEASEGVPRDLLRAVMSINKVMGGK